MSILEILEAHYNAAWNDQGRRECACGHAFTARYSAPIHRAHVAQVLEQHEREAKAEALIEAAEKLFGVTLDNKQRDWLRNRAEQIRKETRAE